MLALRTASTHNDIALHFRSAGLIDNKEYDTMKHISSQVRSLVTDTLKTNNKRGRANDDKRGFFQSLILGAASTPPDDNTSKTNGPSLLSQIKQIGLPISTGRRMFMREQQRRRAIRNGVSSVNYSKVLSRKGFWLKIDAHIRKKVDSWIRSHHHVVHSPIAQDTVLVLDLESSKLVRKNKLLLQCSVRELHSDLYTPNIGLGDQVRDNNGNPLISDTMFWSLLLSL